MSILIGHLRDFQLAEDSLQDALASALVHWQRSGVPRSPAAWVQQTARRKAIDRLRRSARFRQKSLEITALIDLANDDPPEEGDPIGDERLKLILTCCHPAIDFHACVALTLRSVCGLTTEEIARAFVVARETMAQRLVRARRKITAAGIPYEVPGPDGWTERLSRVLGVIYLIFNEGYAASRDELIRHDLCAEAVRLCEILLTLCPEEAEAEGLLALMHLHQARSPARMVNGELIALDAQDRTLWNRPQIETASRLLQGALRRGRPGPYQLQAAISAVHCESAAYEATNWREIVQLYELLMLLQPNAVTDLNRIVARSYIDGAETALDSLLWLGAELETYQPYHAARADLLARTGDLVDAVQAYDVAIALSGTDAEKVFLERKRDLLWCRLIR